MWIVFPSPHGTHDAFPWTQISSRAVKYNSKSKTQHTLPDALSVNRPHSSGHCVQRQGHVDTPDPWEGDHVTLLSGPRVHPTSRTRPICIPFVMRGGASENRLCFSSDCSQENRVWRQLSLNCVNGVNWGQFSKSLSCLWGESYNGPRGPRGLRLHLRCKQSICFRLVLFTYWMFCSS